MSNLLASLGASGDALDVFQQALDVVQNNVTNASTPGYARQRLPLEAQPFDIPGGLSGGVAAGTLESARDNFADEQVRLSQQTLGAAQGRSDGLAPLQGVFDLSNPGSIGGALNALFSSFSNWSVTPNDPSAQQRVLDSARALGVSFQQAASTVNQASTNLDQEIGATVAQINDLAGRLASLNQARLQSAGPDPGLDAQRTATLEQLASLTDITAAQQDDGTTTVLLAGQTPLVVGNQSFQLQTATQASDPSTEGNSNAPLPVRLLDAQGNDVTAQADSGRLGGLLDVRDRVIPGLIGDPTQPGSLNALAQSIAGQVNQLLAAGQTAAGAPGAPLFSYDATNPTGAARTLALNPALTPSQLAAIDPGPPYRSNGVAVDLAALASGTRINGESYTDYYGGIASGIGQEVSDAQNAASAGQQQAAQAKSLRDQISGVSLDEEAVHMMEFQHAYEATARVIQVLDQLTETTVNMISSS